MNVNCEELISKVKEFGGLMEKIKKSVDDFQKQLEDFKSDSDKKFNRVNNGETYYTIDPKEGKFIVKGLEEELIDFDEALYKNNNYFISFNRAQEVADKLNHLMRLERLHDELCPDFVPILNPMDMKDGQAYYTIYFNSFYKCYSYYAIQQEYFGCSGFPVCVLFPTKKIAQQACDILNAELEQAKE